MDIHLTNEQEAIKNSAKVFLQKEADNLAREVEASDKKYSPEIWRKMAELGWMTISFPEEFGGSEGDFMDLVLVLEEMGRAIVPGPFIPSVVCSGHTILKYGNETHKKEFLKGITSGNIIVAPAFIKPSASCSEEHIADNIKSEGQGHVISGTRLFAPYAHVADWLIYAVETSDGTSVFLVDTKSKGVTTNLLDTIASDGQCQVVLENVMVPDKYVLGKPLQGEEIVRNFNKIGALVQSSYILGLLEQILKMSVEYAKKREQFGRPIGSFQAIQHFFADMATDIDEVKYLTYQAACKLSENLPAIKEISMAKARASDAARSVSLLGTKIHGGIGIIIDYDMQLFFRRAKAAEISFGDADKHREIVARELGL